MNKPISPTIHGALDYSTIAATAVAPRLLGLPDRAAGAAYALAGGYLALSALTDYPPALKRTIPFRAHGMADVALGMAIPALPWILGFGGNRKARNFFLALTAVTAVVTALTDWDAREKKRR